MICGSETLCNEFFAYKEHRKVVIIIVVVCVVVGLWFVFFIFCLMCPDNENQRCKSALKEATIFWCFIVFFPIAILILVLCDPDDDCCESKSSSRNRAVQNRPVSNANNNQAVANNNLPASNNIVVQTNNQKPVGYKVESDAQYDLNNPYNQEKYLPDANIKQYVVYDLDNQEPVVAKDSNNDSFRSNDPSKPVRLQTAKPEEDNNTYTPNPQNPSNVNSSSDKNKENVYAQLYTNNNKNLGNPSNQEEDFSHNFNNYAKPSENERFKEEERFPNYDELRKKETSDDKGKKAEEENQEIYVTPDPDRHAEIEKKSSNFYIMDN